MYHINKCNFHNLLYTLIIIIVIAMSTMSKIYLIFYFTVKYYYFMKDITTKADDHSNHPMKL